MIQTNLGVIQAFRNLISLKIYAKHLYEEKVFVSLRPNILSKIGKIAKYIE